MRSRMMAQMIKHLLDRILRRPPDFLIGGEANPYMLRWFVIPRNRFFNVYRHVMLHSDDDRALHDHPWWSLSLCLSGRLTEILSSDGRKRRAISAGDFRLRSARMGHRLELPSGEQAETLFITGPRIREWGFWCPKGWRHWEEFVARDDHGSVGRGCD